MSVSITLNVNGVPYPVSVEQHRTLVTVIRSEIGLTGTKEGCDDCECGACMVLVDGRPVNSCSYLAVQADGREVTTVEGLGTVAEPHPLQRNIVAEGGVQCGFCTPGMLISATALLAQSPQPSEDEIRIALGGNLCRCTGYTKIVQGRAAHGRRAGRRALTLGRCRLHSTRALVADDQLARRTSETPWRPLTFTRHDEALAAGASAGIFQAHVATWPAIVAVALDRLPESRARQRTSRAEVATGTRPNAMRAGSARRRAAWPPCSACGAPACDLGCARRPWPARRRRCRSAAPRCPARPASRRSASASRAATTRAPAGSTGGRRGRQRRRRRAGGAAGAAARAGPAGAAGAGGAAAAARRAATYDAAEVLHPVDAARRSPPRRRRRSPGTTALSRFSRWPSRVDPGRHHGARRGLAEGDVLAPRGVRGVAALELAVVGASRATGGAGSSCAEVAVLRHVARLPDRGVRERRIDRRASPGRAARGAG